MSPCTCKHHTGSQNTHCKAGVAYLDVTTEPDDINGIAFRTPCIDWVKFKGDGTKLSEGQLAQFNRRGTCAKREEPTAQEIAEHEAEMKKHTDKFMLVLPAIKKLKAEHNESWAGVVECPVCRGKLNLKLNVFFSEHQGVRQKHAHGRCETKDCVAWME